MGRYRPGRQVDSALRAVEYLADYLPIGESSSCNSPSVGFRWPLVGGVTWPSGHDHRLSLVGMEAHSVKEAHQDVERSLQAGALWWLEDSIIGVEIRHEGLHWLSQDLDGVVLGALHYCHPMSHDSVKNHVKDSGWQGVPLGYPTVALEDGPVMPPPPLPPSGVRNSLFASYG